MTKRKAEAVAKSTGTPATSHTKKMTEDVTESASESDAESSDDDSATSSSDGEQVSGRATGAADFQTDVGKPSDDDDDDDDDDELLVKKTTRVDILLEPQHVRDAMPKPAESQVACLLSQ